jgi:hypothetical protein
VHFSSCVKSSHFRDELLEELALGMAQAAGQQQIAEWYAVEFYKRFRYVFIRSFFREKSKKFPSEKAWKMTPFLVWQFGQVGNARVWCFVVGTGLCCRPSGFAWYARASSLTSVHSSFQPKI